MLKVKNYIHINLDKKDYNCNYSDAYFKIVKIVAK